MPDNVVEQLFSLFTSSDRAHAIAGDLAEEREQCGWLWFWLHVVGVTFVLWRNAATEAPLRTLTLMLAGVVFLLAGLGGMAGNPDVANHVLYCAHENQLRSQAGDSAGDGIDRRARMSRERWNRRG